MIGKVVATCQANDDGCSKLVMMMKTCVTDEHQGEIYNYNNKCVTD